MDDEKICPFYGKSDDLCEVGCLDISSYEVSLIIKYCSLNYEICTKFQQLAERPSDMAAAGKRRRHP